MSIQMNQSLSVDCAVFGFNGKSLKVLLIERRYYAPDTRLDKLKLPGAMILDNETLPQAAYRVLEEATGLRDVYLKQMDIFSDPNRVSGEELEWINRYHGIRTERVVTVGYYALVKLDTRTVAYTTAKGAQWVDVDSIQRLAMDHKQILSAALAVARIAFSAARCCNRPWLSNCCHANSPSARSRTSTAQCWASKSTTATSARRYSRRGF